MSLRAAGHGPAMRRRRRGLNGLRGWLGLAGAAALALAGPALGQEPAVGQDVDEPVTGVTGVEGPESTPTPEDGPSYPVSAFELRYLRESSEHPPLEEIMQVEVELAPTTQGYVSPRPGEKTIHVRLADVAARPLEVYYASAIQRILEAVRDRFSEIGLIGLYVTPDLFQIDETGQDLRPQHETRLTLVVTTGIVSELRTLASGRRIDRAERVNNPLHERIRIGSPLQPYQADDPEAASLLRKDELDRYVFFLGRHPGRRVDVALSAGMEPGTSALDYIITENNPLSLYFQVSNTGTEDTSEWRERFGLVHTQLTNNDDTLTIDYSTADFDEYNAITGAYEAPFSNDRIRWRVESGYSDYQASDVGVLNERFRGHSWFVSGEIIANVYQRRELFIDLFGGARYESIDVNNPTFGLSGEDQFLIPYIGVRLERSTEWFSTYGSLSVEFQDGDWTGVDTDDLDALGRTDPDDDWTVLKWSLRHAFYLEPVLDRDAWEDPTTPASSTLAHEIEMSFRGQWAFDRRLIAQEERVVGGLYTVRGYDESLAAGDTVLLASLQYNFHVPRAFRIEPEPGRLFGRTFRASPQHVYGMPDWDLVLSGFVDAARVLVSDRLSFESDETFVGAGLGVEIRYRRNARITVDWGVALRDVRNNDAGDSRFHILATFLY